MGNLRSTVQAAAVTGLLAIAGCSGTTDFTVTANFTNVSTTAGTAYSRNVAVDLQAQAGNAWKHRNKVKSLDLVALDATVTSLPTAPMTGSGTIWIGPGTATSTSDAGVVQVGNWPSEAVTAAPHSIGVQLSQASLDVIENALKGDGRFVVFLTGTTVDAETFDATAVLHIKLKYKVP